MENLFPPAVYGLVLSLACIYFIWKLCYGNFGQQKVRVAYVTEIRTHPVKSAKPLLMKKIEMTDIGMKFDRFVYHFLQWEMKKNVFNIKRKIVFFIFSQLQSNQ